MSAAWQLLCARSKSLFRHRCPANGREYGKSAAVDNTDYATHRPMRAHLRNFGGLALGLPIFEPIYLDTEDARVWSWLGYT